VLKREHRCEWRERAEASEREVARLHREAAFEDPDTGLGNLEQLNRDFTRLVGRSRRYGEAFSLVLVSVHDYQRAGAELEHATVATLARALIETARVEDIPCRVGDNEFAVLLPLTDLAGARAFLDRVRTNISREPAKTNSGSRFFTATGGCAEWDENLGGLRRFLEAADLDLENEARAISRHTDSFRALEDREAS
jgi:diguanylate cyclase (GGDEF)-like protein